MKRLQYIPGASNTDCRRILRLLGWISFILVAVCFPPAALAQTKIASKEAGSLDTPSSQSMGPQRGRDELEYIIAPDDLLDIYVIDVPELSRQYRVSPDGNIALPLLSEPITAAGLSPGQLSSVIATKLRSAGMVTNAAVTVNVQASQGHSVAITGSVRNPQVFPIFGQTNLLTVLSQAGGLADDAGDIAMVTRGETAMRALSIQGSQNQADDAAPPDTLRVNLKKLFENADRNSNIPIYPGDTVTVLRAGVVYVVGAVNRAGGYTLARSWENMTVLKAVALAGNVTSTANRKKAVIIRKDAAVPGGHKEIPVNLRLILAGKAPDKSLEANDILFVPDSSGKKALHRGAQAALSIGSGLLIYHAPL
jgi:polysaccharide export outer membrane protein